MRSDIRVTRKKKRELRDLVYRLESLPPASCDAYMDRCSRSPITWYLATAIDELRVAQRLADALNKLGANILRIETDRPPPILWEDDVQVVTRRPRHPDRPPDCVVVRRHLERRKRTQRRRQRTAYNKARAAKTGFK